MWLWLNWFSKKQDLPNRHYYKAIDEAMRDLPTPTVDGAIRAMRQQGNRVYSRAFGTGMEWRFKDYGEQYHEIAHLAGRFGHTTQMETFLLAFEQGLARGSGVSLCDATESTTLQDNFKAAVDYYNSRTYSNVYKDGNADPSKTNQAINFAAGLYLRDRVDRYVAYGMMQKTYEQQAEFCAQDVKSDEIIPLRKPDYSWPDIAHAPYALTQLSSDEWREIVGVATGLTQPEKTQHPARMTAIKEALVHTGMFHDRPKSIAERIERERAEKDAETTR